MKLNYKYIIYAIISIVSLVIIVLILSNTIFYDYKAKTSEYLDKYYINAKVDDLNKLILRYKNNTNRTMSINEIINNKINTWIDNYNKKDYESNKELNDETTLNINRIEYLLDNIENNLDVKNNKNTFIDKIEKLKESKLSYLEALKYFNENDLNNAYEYFSKVIKEDNYYLDTTNKIDVCINNTVSIISDKVKSLTNIDDKTTPKDKIAVYKEIFNYLKDTKANTKFDLSMSKTYKELYDENIKNLKESYIEYVDSLKANNEYVKAIECLDELIKLLTEEDIKATEIIELRDECNNMLPSKLTDLNKEVNGSLIKDELALTDIDNRNHAYGLTFYKNEEQISTVTYSLNKEYILLTGKIVLAKKINNNSKDFGIIKIYGDDKLLFTSNKIDASYKSQDIIIKLNDIDKLKIEYKLNYNSKNNIEEIMAILANPTLNKY